jgi:hypothetical protein
MAFRCHCDLHDPALGLVRGGRLFATALVFAPPLADLPVGLGSAAVGAASASVCLARRLLEPCLVVVAQKQSPCCVVVLLWVELRC